MAVINYHKRYTKLESNVSDIFEKVGKTLKQPFFAHGVGYDGGVNMTPVKKVR